MVERVGHGSLTLYRCFFPLLYPSKYLIHSIRTSIPFNLIKDENKQQNNAMSLVKLLLSRVEFFDRWVSKIIYEEHNSLGIKNHLQVMEFCLKFHLILLLLLPVAPFSDHESTPVSYLWLQLVPRLYVAQCCSSLLLNWIGLTNDTQSFDSPETTEGFPCL